MPSGNVDKPVIEDNRDGTVSISYGPREEGLHELYIKYNGEHVQGMQNKKMLRYSCLVNTTHVCAALKFTPAAFLFRK